MIENWIEKYYFKRGGVKSECPHKLSVTICDPLTAFEVPRTRIRVKQSTVHARRDYYSSCTLHTPASCIMGTGGPFPGGKARPGRDADHSPPYSAEVVNE
jgi:hypothetical protein